MSRLLGRPLPFLASVFALIGLSCPSYEPLEPSDPPADDELATVVDEPSPPTVSASSFDLPTDDTPIPLEEPHVTVPSAADLLAAGVADDDHEAVVGPPNSTHGGEDVAGMPSGEPASAELLADDAMNDDSLTEEVTDEGPGDLADEEIEEEVFEMVALRKETWVFAEPTWDARRIGYLRAGSRVHREQRPAGFKNCKEGWYRIEPKGFLCAGKSASIETHHPMVEAAGKAPDRTKGLPYPTVMAEFPPPPRYVRLPSEEEQARVEPDRAKYMLRKRDTSLLESLAEDIPGSLLYGRSLPSPYAQARPPDALHLGQPVPRTGWGLLHVFSWTDRWFGVTSDLDLIPLDRTKLIATSTMVGTHLVEDQGLPVAFVHAHSARLYRIDPDTRVVRDVGDIRFREGFSLSGRRTRVGEQLYFETRDGYYLREGPRMVVVPELKEFPTWATKGRKWIDVSILRQTLVAYEGTRPVFATMVSTGADGLGDPKETHSTVLGAFLIHTKHVSVTMRGNEPGDTYDLQDVPYAQFFHEGYALHGAYWHDGFGTPRSHGCINLSPQDAAWLFAWTDPEVPKGWHGKLQLRGGTLVYTHP